MGTFSICLPACLLLLLEAAWHSLGLDMVQTAAGRTGFLLLILYYNIAMRNLG